jgi:hypothetical protein
LLATMNVRFTSNNTPLCFFCACHGSWVSPLLLGFGTLSLICARFFSSIWGPKNIPRVEN